MKIPIKILISITILISLLSGLIPVIQNLFALSWWGVHHFFLWQFLTYIFVEKGPLSLGFFFSLAFNMYLLWIFGSSLIERVGKKIFFLLYFSSTLVGGLISLSLPHFFLSGSMNAIYALLIAWMILNPGSKLLLFFALPFKSYVLILTLICVTILLELSGGNWAAGISLFTASVYSYFFSILVWRQISPFSFLNSFERKMLRLLEKKAHHFYHSSKIYDIRSGKPLLDDDQFMDAMLDRISRHGEGSLTRAEKKRMKEISKRRAEKR